MNELKSCPFCGSLAVVEFRLDSDWGVDLKYGLLNDESNYEIKSMIADENYNPDYHTGDYWDIEIYRCQSCRAEWGVGTDVCIAELHARIAELEEENDRLQFWYAELEAENDQLTAHSDIERQDDKWIPVSERLPEDGKPVWVCTIWNEQHSGFLIDGVWGGLFRDFREGEVTYWMSLPEPPESPNDTQTQTFVYGKERD